jgi:iron complex outermembrane receptor protein
MREGPNNLRSPGEDGVNKQGTDPMILKQMLAAGTASGIAIAMATLAPAAHAQSTGSVEVEKEIVVTATRSPSKGVDGVAVPDGSKSRAVLTQEFIANQRPGQSVNEIINMVPGVSFQNNDPYGASGGTMTIRGFDATRISQTFDGIPLNDTGNYALYSQQQLDSELIEQVNVNLGTTDVDSPTAAASGSTVNYRTRNPYEDFHVKLAGSIGDFKYFRLFGVLDTGTFTPFGTRAFVAFSHSENENPFQHLARTDRWQYNAKIYQPIGSNGDFVSIAGHYNLGRNQNFSSIPLRIDPTQISVTGSAPNQVLVQTPRVVGVATTNRFPVDPNERDYTYKPCQTDTPQTGVADVPSGCGTLFDQSFNPSNTANIRINSRFTLTDGLVLTVDPSFQYVKANGGTGAVKGNEGSYTRAAGSLGSAITTPIFGYIGGQPYFGGIDLNGDGDVIDTPTVSRTTGTLGSTSNGVTVYAPSETTTRRYGVIANLIWDFAEGHTLRLNYSHDYGRHKQTGEVTFIKGNGATTTYFPIDNAINDATGKPMEKRNRLSFAILDQVSGEYRGHFLDNRLQINIGLRSPWFTRKLNNYCVTEAGGSFVDCFNDPVSQAAFLAASPTSTPPISREFKFHRLLPTGGFNFQVADNTSIYGSYTKGLQVPGTDNLYQSLGFAPGAAQPKPETTDNFDLGVRYRAGKLQAQLAGWYTIFNNRLASSYDPVLDLTVYRNLGTVDKYGLDASIAYAPIPEVSIYVFGSLLQSHIRDNVQSGECTAGQVAAGASTGIGTCTAVGQAIYYLTEGKREGGSPTYTFGGRVEGHYGPAEFGVQLKQTGPRYVNDQNIPIFQSYTLNGAATNYQVYPAKTPAYTVVDLDAKVNLSFMGLNEDSYLQFNLTNVFDELYVAGFTPNTAANSIPFAFVGAPRTWSATLIFAF